MPAPLRQPGNHGRANIDTGATSICRSGRSRCERGAHQALRGNRRAREDAVAEHLPLQHRQRQPVEPQLAVEAEFTAGGVVDAQRLVFLEVGADAGQGMPHADAVRLEILRRTDARELQ